jgi:DNA polymerase
VVFSDGPDTAKIILVGEGPGKTEDQTGVPFSGPAGELLNKILASVNIKRNEVYITNSVRCFPHDVSSPYGSPRQPHTDELNACRPLLLAEIKFIRPRVIILAGATAVKTLLGAKATISSMAGKWATISGVSTMSIFHPASILHTSSYNTEMCLAYKKSVWNSMKEIRKFLDNQPVDTTPVVSVYGQDELGLGV